MASPFFSGRIPQELNDRINQHCTETGESKTQVLLNALSKYLDFPIKPPVTTAVSAERFNQLEQRVAELEKKIEITGVGSADNILTIEDETNDNSVNTVKQPDNNIITDNCDNGDNNNKQDVETVSENQTQLSILNNEQQSKVDQGNNKPWIVKTNMAPELPGLENMDKQKILQKLRNAKATGKTEVQIRQYFLRYYGREEGTKGSLFWEVITEDNKA